MLGNIIQAELLLVLSDVARTSGPGRAERQPASVEEAASQQAESKLYIQVTSDVVMRNCSTLLLQIHEHYLKLISGVCGSSLKLGNKISSAASSLLKLL